MERLGLSRYLLHSLHGAGIRTLEELRSQSPDDLAKLPGIGSARLSELLAALHPIERDRSVEDQAHINHLQAQIAGHRRSIETLQGEISRIRAAMLSACKPACVPPSS